LACSVEKLLGQEARHTRRLLQTAAQLHHSHGEIECPSSQIISDFTLHPSPFTLPCSAFSRAHSVPVGTAKGEE
jgi:hypothetical protein